jgi:hypothetical protein
MTFLRSLIYLSLTVVFLIAGCSGGPAAQPPAAATEPAAGPIATPTAAPSPTTLPSVPNSTAVTAATTSSAQPVKGYEVSGTVLSGGDTSPKGLMDAPRKLAYQLKTQDGRIITVTYTAFPPSPVGDKQKITLKFHQGGVQPGDVMKARGSFDENTLTLLVAEQGDYIETVDR